MNKSILLAFALAMALTACGDGCKAYKDRVQQQEAQEDNSCKQFMTNAQIIDETKTCNDAGLDAEALHCGDDHQTVLVQCKPRSLGSTE